MPKNLLLADDSITIQKVVGITFAGEDFKITAVDNGEDAISRARELRPDVILADVVMPRRNGYEVCEAIKADPALQHIPVLLLAGTFEAFDESRARAARADGHIAKPFESQALINKVKELLGIPLAQPGPGAQIAASARAPQRPAPSFAATPVPSPGAVRPPASPAPGGQAVGRPSPGIAPPGARPPMPAAPIARPGLQPPPASARPGMPPSARPPMPGMPLGARPSVPPPGSKPPLPGVPTPAGRPPIPAPPVMSSPRPPGVAPGVRPFAVPPPSPAPLPFARPAQSPMAATPPSPRPAPAPAETMQRRDSLKLDAPAHSSPSNSSFELDWSDVDVSEELPESMKGTVLPDLGKTAIPARAAAPPRAPSGPAFSELTSPTPAQATRATPGAPAPIPSADVVPLDELDFGESAFAAPPRPAVQPAPEAEPVELPMLEAEEEIELTPVSEPTPSVAETRAEIGEPDAAPLPAQAGAEISPAAGWPARGASAASEWLVARGVPDLTPAAIARAPAGAPAPVPSDGGEAQLRDALSRASREVIERIAWEVVPQLAETIIREQIDRLVKERQR